MIWRRNNGKQQANTYATVEDFCGLFTAGMDELYQLSFLLTADHQKAEQCFVAGLEDALRSKGVFKEWVRSWAKRTIIENAIWQLKPHPRTANIPALTVPICVGEAATGEDRHLGLKAVLALPDFERFVFVMTVLERYSGHDATLLLGCSPRDIREARALAVEQMGNSKGTVPVEINPEKIQELAG